MSDVTNGPVQLAALQEQLAGRSAAACAALEDVVELCGDVSIIGWIDPREPPNVTVYVLGVDAGILYMLEGKPDPAPDPANADAERTAACKFTAFPITRESTFSLSVVSKWRGDADPGTAHRSWRFRIARDAQGLDIEYPSADSSTWPAGADPTPFARALAREIVRVQSRRQDG